MENNILMHFLKESKQTKRIIMLFFIYIFIALADIFVAESTGVIVQNVALNNMHLVMIGVTILALAKIVYSILKWVSEIYSCDIKESVIINYRSLAIKSILNADYQWIQTLNVGDILGRMQEDVGMAAEAIAKVIPDIAKRLIIAISIFIVLIFENWKLAMAFIVTIPLLFVFQSLAGKVCEKYFAELRDAEGERDAQIQDILNNINVIKFFNCKDATINWLDIKLKKYIQKCVKAMYVMVVAFSPSNIVSQVPTILVCGLGCALVKTGELDIKQLVTAFTLCTYGVEELRGLSNAYANLPNMMSYSKRLFPLWDAPKEVNGNKYSMEKNIDISLKNVCFKYKEQEKSILKNINLNIKQGKFTVIVGESGCGKSTILKLIAGLYEPNKGQVLVDDISLQEWDKDRYRERVGFLTQDSYIFPKTLLENLSLVKKNIGDVDEELLNTEIKTILQPIIKTLSDGINTQISENGRNISGGQKQRIAIARALICKPDILLMDESTSALDVETEKNVYDIIKKLYKEKTVIAVAHKLTSIIHADYILVMDKGKIVEEGTHQELMKLNGKYKQMYKEESKEIHYA